MAVLLFYVLRHVSEKYWCATYLKKKIEGELLLEAVSM
jgi:hypothetical protein